MKRHRGRYGFKKRSHKPKKHIVRHTKRHHKKYRRNPTTLGINPESLLVLNARKRGYKKRGRKHHYRRNPGIEELIGLGLINPARLTPAQKEKLRTYYGHGRKQYEISAMTGHAGSTIRKYTKGVGMKKRKGYKKHHRKPGRPRKYHKRTKKYHRRRWTRVLRIPKGSKKLRIRWNPGESMGSLKRSATLGFYGLLGYVGAYFLSKLIGSAINKNGTTSGLTLGPLTSDTVVSIISALAFPFLPIHFAEKDYVMTGVWINAFARVGKDVLPAGSTLQSAMPLPSGLGGLGWPTLPAPYEEYEGQQFPGAEETGVYPEQGIYSEDTGEYFG